LGGTVTTSPAVTQQADNSVYLFVGGACGELSEQNWIPAQGWAGWQAIGSPIT
jgi:hypothetical protein